MCFSSNFRVCSRNLDELSEKNIECKIFFCLVNDAKKPRVGKMFAKSDKDIRIVRREETNEKLKTTAKKLQQKFHGSFCAMEINSLCGEVLISEE